ncbi:hypothetical protein HOP50_13g68140 [Chloropicon primus]|uniref:Uncharacterized protein n=1 Tax=Chloropicon primus TaxID=1764295 RepID=A0A5B8MU19_9CHLO|nr:hypothetical protein A3770_13p67960 [Chloropicon primus]UPR03485.1 hypothetical protein HOP50_13g68140 [Chloropicon primus]|eukprot:QDZ24278.1 hypothetical protein A3770_13p67960 [Chloropicon primus]
MVQQGKGKGVLDASREKMGEGLRVFLHIMKHENVTNLRRVVFAYLKHAKEKLAPLLKLATWVEVWKHPLTRRARAHANQVMKLVRVALGEIFRNLLLLLSEANKLARSVAAKKLEESKRKSYSELASTILSGLVAARGVVTNSRKESKEPTLPSPPRSPAEEESVDLELQQGSESPAIPSQVSPMPLAGVMTPGTVSASPKEDIKSLCSGASVSVSDLIDLNSENNDDVMFVYNDNDNDDAESVEKGSDAEHCSPERSESHPSPGTVPRMWQSYNPEDIKTCAKSTPACRSKYCNVGQDMSPGNYSCTETEDTMESMATAQSYSRRSGLSEDDEVVNTPESVNIDMTVYSTGTPFKENVLHIQDQMRALDFGSSKNSPLQSDPGDKENLGDQSLPVPLFWST